nr:helicase-like transcription factor CHR28 isoform X1 [Ipomoea batatas]
MVDMEVLWNLLAETESDSSQSRQEDSSLSFAPHDSRSGVLDGSLHSKERAVIFDPPLHSCSGSLTDLQPIQGHGQFCSDKDNAFYSSASNIQDDRLSHSHLIAENNLKAPVTSNMVESSWMEIETPQYNESHALFSSGQISDLLDEPWEQYSDMLLGDNEEWGPSTWDAGSNNIVSGEGLTRRTNEGVVDGYSNTRDINVDFQHACKSELHFTGYKKQRETDCKVATQSWAYDPSYVFSRKQEGLDCVKTENIHSLRKTNDSCLLTTAHQSVQSSSLAQRTCAATGDDDVCILEDISASARPNPCPPNGKSLVNLQHATFSETSTRVGAGYMRFKPNGEQFVFRTALQRIALSWMVKKETTNPRCSGGILADDQGLGKDNINHCAYTQRKVSIC